MCAMDESQKRKLSVSEIKEFVRAMREVEKEMKLEESKERCYCFIIFLIVVIALYLITKLFSLLPYLVQSIFK